ncbi:MAG: NAD-dependent epimerase/dehydratase family protein [Marinilabiliaceae bacterium]
MSKVLVTGANGLLATNVINELLTNGYEVRGLLRNSKKYRGPGHDNLQFIETDITDTKTLNKAIKGCNLIIHVAALTSHHITEYSPYQKINAEATETLIQQSIQNHCKKFIYVSSANAFGFGDINTPGDESQPIRPPFSESFYAQSKLEGQERVLKYRDQIHVTVVNPTFMIGPFDGKPSSGQIIKLGYKKKIIFCPPGGKNFVNASDAARGVVAALEKGKNGEAYLLAGENLTYREFFQKLSALTQNKAIYVTLPGFLLRFAGRLGNFLQKTGIQTPLSLTNNKMLCVKNFYNNQKAIQELDVVFEPIEKGIREAIEWFRKNDML